MGKKRKRRKRRYRKRHSRKKTVVSCHALQRAHQRGIDPIIFAKIRRQLLNLGLDSVKGKRVVEVSIDDLVAVVQVKGEKMKIVTWYTSSS